MSLNELFVATFSRFSEKVAFYFEGREITFGEIEKRAGEVAASLLSLRVEPGSRVAVFLPNGPDLICAHLGINFAGAVRSMLIVPMRLTGFVGY